MSSSPQVSMYDHLSPAEEAVITVLGGSCWWSLNDVADAVKQMTGIAQPLAADAVRRLVARELVTSFRGNGATLPIFTLSAAGMVRRVVISRDRRVGQLTIGGCNA